MAMDLGGGSGKPGRAVPNINVTPLVDIVLVVLIIFMIVTLMATKTFSLLVPPKPEDKQEKQTPPSEVKTVVMTVDKAGVIRVNQTVLKKGEIPKRLPRLMAGAGQRVLYFDAHDEATYGTALQAMDLSRAAGVKSIAILTQNVAR